MLINLRKRLNVCKIERSSFPGYFFLPQSISDLKSLLFPIDGIRVIHLVNIFISLLNNFTKLWQRMLLDNWKIKIRFVFILASVFLDLLAIFYGNSSTSNKSKILRTGFL